MNHSSTYDDSSWLGLLLLQAFRGLTALLLLGFDLSGYLSGPLALLNPGLFRGTNFLYLLLALGGHVLLFLHLLPFRNLLYLLYTIDLLVYAMLMYASGGVSSNLQVLLFISLFGTVVLDQGRTFLLTAAVSTLALLFVEWVTFLRAPYLAHIIQAGFYSAGFFGAVFVGAVLARRAAHVEVLLLRQGRQLVRQARLNSRIVQLLRTGILVIDENERLSLFNARAAQLLHLRAADRGRPMDESLAVLRQLISPKDMSGPGKQNLLLRLRGKELQVSSMPGGRRPGDSRGGEWILLVEDMVPIRRRMQQMKLASLGQLTAGIAHEVRTPLAAIRHAAQLLRDDTAGVRNSEEVKLLRIMEEHCRRLNHIVENVMSLGRNRPAVLDRLDLFPWLGQFAAELIRLKGLADTDVELVGFPGLWVNVDPIQLHQVLWNLSENALRYSRHAPRVILRCGHQETMGEAEGIYLEVADNGHGIKEDAMERIFEPFFTTESSGSGLGLYVAHELCQANQALLSLRENSPRGCTFHISFGSGEEHSWGSWVAPGNFRPAHGNPSRGS